MINTKTVLVLGAGASKSYGFPIGSELVREIVEGLRPGSSNQLIPFLTTSGIKDQFIQTFRDELLFSGKYSVDKFLERRPEYVEIGKLSICFCLAKYENENILVNPHPYPGWGWYQYLFNLLDSDIDRFHENNLSIINFNYDRSFEHSLFRAISSTYGSLLWRECEKALKEIPIIHVHGQLGGLPWQKEDGRFYSPRFSSKELKMVSNEIEILSEIKETSPLFDQARDLMKKADRIIFLGFGYNETNLRRLDIEKFSNKFLGGTAFDLGKSQINQIRDRWKIRLSEPNIDILSYLKDHISLA
ncbi:MAG: hypothetical protein KJ687_10700 [Proteobacteria bacterium]|nr:hypothetical protein [Pseudomonadota bacterium]